MKALSAHQIKQQLGNEIQRIALDSPLLPFVFALVLGSLTLWQGLVSSGWNPTVFVGADARWSDARVLGRDFIVDKNSGYDGQFYYRLARDPFTTTRSAYGVTLDMPAYRHQRILYPFLAWCLSFGKAAWTPWALIAVNLIAFCAIGWLGGAWAKLESQHAMWGALPLFHLGFSFSLLGDLTEIVEIAFLLGGLLLVKKKRFGRASLCLCLAVLAKETALPAAMAVAVASLFLQWKSRAKTGSFDVTVLFLLTPLAIYFALQFVLWRVWGTMPLAMGSGNLSFPLSHLSVYLADAVSSPWQNLSSLEKFRSIGLVGIISFMALVLFHIQRSQAARYLKVAWLMFAFLFLCLSDFVLSVDTHFSRAFSECFVLGILLLMSAPIRTRFALMVCVAALNGARNFYLS